MAEHDPTRRGRSAAVPFAIATLLFASATWARTPKPAGRKDPKLVESWMARLQAADGSLRAGEWKKAKQSLEQILHEMYNRIEGGESAGQILAMAALLRSIAEAGLGDAHLASWDFSVARALHPAFETVDLSAYGEAGATLSALPRELDKLAGLDAAAKSARGSPTVRPPVRRNSPAPHFPFAKRAACSDGPVYVMSVIRTDGLPWFPTLVSEQDPVLAFAALEALRRWRFYPARWNGKAIDTFYTLTVNFELPTCTGRGGSRERPAERR